MVDRINISVEMFKKTKSSKSVPRSVRIPIILDEILLKDQLNKSQAIQESLYLVTQIPLILNNMGSSGVIRFILRGGDASKISREVLKRLLKKEERAKDILRYFSLIVRKQDKKIARILVRFLKEFYNL